MSGFTFKPKSIKSYLIILIVIFILASVITAVFVLEMSDDISIESELYQSIDSSHKLIADMLPPKLYIVEPYLLIQQLSTETDHDQAVLLEEKIASTRADYYAYYKQWQTDTEDETVSALLLASHGYVDEFFRIYDQAFLPALAVGDYPLLQEIANNQMLPLFEEHRQIIIDASDYLENLNQQIEIEAKSYAHRLQIIIFCVYIISIFILLAVSIIVFKHIADTEKDIVSSQRETQLTNERLETMVEGLKKFKHSHDNILASINGYVLEDDMQGLSAYLNEIIVEKNKQETLNYFKLNFIKNPAVAGLILAKMLEAEKSQIEFALKVRSDIADIKIQSSDICEILGILLDNALEAGAASEDKQVRVKIEESDDAHTFTIINSFHQQPDPQKMFEEGWTTKGENHGFGLWRAKEIINKYDNVVLNTTINNTSLEAELIVFKSVDILEEPIFTDVL